MCGRTTGGDGSVEERERGADEELEELGACVSAGGDGGDLCQRRVGGR